MVLEIYNRTNAYKNELRRLKEAKISEKNRQLISYFHNHLFSKNISELRVTKLSTILRKTGELLNLDFCSMTKNDLINIVGTINRKENFSEETKADYRKCLKQFYRWYRDEDERLESKDVKLVRATEKFYKYLFEAIPSTCELKSLNYSDILTDNDISQIIEKGCHTFKEKALIKLLHETGCRIGEILNIKIKDIEFKENRALLRVDGKTGERRVFILHSLPLLTKWLEIHPKRDDLDSYVWIGENRNNTLRGKPLRHTGAQKLIKKCFKRAGLSNKKHNPHWFRHSRATLLAPKVTEFILCKFMGWLPGSRQPKRYVHLCAQQVEDVFLEINGFVKKEEDKTLPIKCSCKSLNEYNSRYCHTCGKPLKVEFALEDEQLKKIEMDKSISLLMEIMKDPKLFKSFQDFKSDVA